MEKGIDIHNYDRLLVSTLKRMKASDISERNKKIIKFLGLENKVPFEMDREYLQNLFGFVASRTANEWKTQKSLEYGYWAAKQKVQEAKIVKSSDNSLNKYFS